MFYINEKVSQQDETKRNLEINIRSEIVDRTVTVTVKKKVSIQFLLYFETLNIHLLPHVSKKKSFRVLCTKC